MDRWSKWQSEVTADLEIIKATLKKGSEAVQSRFQAVQDGFGLIHGRVSDLQAETARQDVAVLEALGRIQVRFSEVGDSFRDQETRLQALEAWRTELERRLAR